MIVIRNRHDNSSIYASETATTVAGAVAEAISANPRANFARADFANADFANACFAGAYFANAYFAWADFAGANFAGANFARADFADAYFADACFADADFADAYFARANFAGANFADAYFAGAYFAGANFARAGFAGAKNIPDVAKAQANEPLPPVPVIPKIHSTLLSAVTAQGCRLDMSAWHTCDTTHCRAGWVVHLAGEAGKAL